MKSTKYVNLTFIFAFVYLVVALPRTVTADSSQPTLCTLIVQDLKQESTEEWRALGYQVIENKEINSLHPAKIAGLLNNSTFIIFRSPPRQELWFSLLDGRSSAQFKPLSFQAPPQNGPVPRNYSCSNMRQRLRFFASTRAAIADADKLFNGRNLTRTRGSLVIDLEYSFFVHNGFTKYNRDKAQAEYNRILEKAREIRLEGGADFFTLWSKVRALIYDKNMTNIDYCPDNASMISALLEKCVNCVGETYLLQALFDDGGFSPPVDWESGVQKFNYQTGPEGGDGHLRPVLYNLKTKRLYDLATGHTARFKGSILKSISVYEELWRGHGALRMDDEVLAMKLRQHPYVWQNWGCYNPVGHRTKRLPRQPSDWSTVAACDLFQKGSSSGRADNQFKANPGTLDEDPEPQNRAATDGSTAPSGAPSNMGHGNGLSVGGVVAGAGAMLMGMIGSAADAIKDGFGGEGSSSLFGSLLEERSQARDRIIIRDLAKPEVQKDLEQLAENLIPAERQILREMIKKGQVTPEAQNIFSESRYSDRLGLAQIKEDPPSADLLLPFYVKYSPDLNNNQNGNREFITLTGPYAKTADGRNAVAEFQTCFNSDSNLPDCFVTNSKALAAEMIDLSGPERLLKLVSLAKEDLHGLAKSIGDLVSETHEDPRIILDRLRDDQTAAKLLMDFGPRLNFYEKIVNNIQSGILHSNGDFENAFERKNMRDVARVFLHVIELHQVTEDIMTKVSDLVFSITEKPIETLRWVDQNISDKNDVSAPLKHVNEGISGISQLLSGNRFSHALIERKFEETLPYKRSSDEGFISAVLLVRALTHPQYFLTVEPERNEVDPYRPYYPLSIHDPRVQEIKVKKGPVMPTKNETYVEVELACDDADDSTIQANRPRLQVHCKPGIPVKGQGNGHDGQDELDREGFVTGNAEQGQLQDQKAGEYEAFRDGATREENLGADRAGEILLKRPLTKEESRYPIQPGAVEIRHGSLKARKKAKVLNSADPRPEVFLDPKTWAFLLEKTKYIDVLEEPVVKLLLHHTFRRKLVPVWRELGVVKFRIFEPADYDPNLLTVSNEEVWKLKEQYSRMYGSTYGYNSVNLTASQFSHLQRPNRELFLGFENEPFVKVAVNELMTKLKPGYLLVKRDGVFRSKDINLKALANSFTLKGPMPPLGFTLPYLCQPEGDTTRIQILLGASDDKHRCYKQDELRSVREELKTDFQGLTSQLEYSSGTSLVYSDEQKQEIAGVTVVRGAFSLNRREIFIPLKESSAPNAMTFSEFEQMMERFGIPRNLDDGQYGQQPYIRYPYPDGSGHF